MHSLRWDLFLCILAATWCQEVRATPRTALPAWAQELEELDPLAGCCDFEGLDIHREHSVLLPEFGAVGDGATDNTKAFRDAVSAIEAAGGGRLVVPAGEWVTGPFNLTSHMTLEILEGAKLLADEVIENYPLVHQPPTYGPGRDYGRGLRRHSLILVFNATDVIITGGNGSVDGRGQVWWDANRRKQLRHTRPHLLEVRHSRCVAVLNTTLRDAPFWNIRPLFSSCLLFRDLTILAPVEERETDGIDPDSSSHILIEDCYVSTGDDAVAVKSGWDMFGYTAGVPSTDIVVRRVTVRSPGSVGLSIGSEMSGGVERVLFEQCTLVGVVSAFRIKSGVGRGGYVKHVLVKDSVVEQVRVPFLVDLYFGHGNAPGFDPKALPRVDSVGVWNLRGVGGRVLRVAGLPDAPVLNVFVADVHIELDGETAPRKAWTCYHANGTVVDSSVAKGATACPHPQASTLMDS